MTKAPGEGHLEARTPPGAAPIAADRAGLEQDGALPGADPADMIAGSPDIDAPDLLAVAAELSAAPRRARGRPAGSGNRKNGDMVAYLAALGHRDPWVTLSMIQTADTGALAQALAMKRGDALVLQLRAAEALMPYHHAKKPQQLELPVGDKRPLMVIGEMNVAIMGGDGFMSAGIAPGEKPNEINGDIVRDGATISHETEMPSDINDLDSQGS